MWPWIKHWRDWVMNDVLPITRLGRQALHFSYEKAGLKLDNQPIAWNAESVLVEVLVRLPSTGRTRTDLTLHLPDHEPVVPESMRREEGDGKYRIFFRLRPPAATTNAELVWRGNRKLGEIHLPILQREDFLRNLTIQMPTISVNLGQQSVACRSFVSTQSKGLMATGMLTSPTSLVPLLDLGLEVEFRTERGNTVQRVPAHFSSSQLADRRALITVTPHKLPRRIGVWVTTWFLEGKPLATQRIKAMSKRQFERSLRISETRFVLQDHKGKIQVTRRPPDMKQVARLGPCFLISSRETGMAGLCTLQTQAIVPGAVRPPLLMEQEVLITDGPTPFMPGTLDAADLQQVTAFELCLGGQSLGILPMTPAPRAAFTAEGGYVPPPDFVWSPAAEDQLVDRLTRLMEDRPNGR